jgi:hypothetical protein
MSTTKTPKKARPLWTIGILAIVAHRTAPVHDQRPLTVERN